MNTIALGNWDYAAMVIYMLAVVLMGFKFSKNEKTSEDYLLGGRNIPYMAVGISCLMSLLSTYSLVMVPGEIFNHGLSLWIMSLLVPILAIPAFMIFMRFYFRIKAFTPFEYLEYRYDRKVRLLVAFLYTYSRGVYLAMVLFATSKVFEGGAGWPAWVTILVVGFIGILYTVLGGMRAVIWTDVLQFIVLVIGIGAAVVVLCMSVDGGFFGAITYAFDNGHGLNRFSDPSFYTCNPYVRLSFWLILLGRIMTPLTTAASDQITIQRLLSTSSYKNAFKAQITSSIINIPFTMVLWFIGLAIYSYYSQNPDPMVKSGDTAFFTFVATKLPTPVPGLIMAAMLAAVMSTLDSGINSLSTIWLKEFHLPYINKNLNDSGQVRVCRISTAVFGIIAVAIGLLVSCTSDIMKQTVVESATIFHAFEAIVFPAFLYAVLSKRANSAMIWIIAALMWGLKFGTLTWYTVTKTVSASWQAGTPLGLAGPISFIWVAIPLAVFAIIFSYWLYRRHTKKNLCYISLSVSLFPFGYALGTGLWYIFSNYNAMSTEPLVVSFQWIGFPVTISFIILGIIGLRLSKIQPKEKWQGLILSDLDEAPAGADK
jgi:SSS family transporter